MTAGSSHEMDPDNPLPDPSMVWRRAFAFIFVAANDATVLFLAQRITDQRLLFKIIVYTIALNLVYALLYMGGASAKDITRLIQTASIRKHKIAAQDKKIVVEDRTGGAL